MPSHSTRQERNVRVLAGLVGRDAPWTAYRSTSSLEGNGGKRRAAEPCTSRLSRPCTPGPSRWLLNDVYELQASLCASSLPPPSLLACEMLRFACAMHP